MNQTDHVSLPGTGERFLPEFDGDMVPEHLHRYLMARQYVAGKAVLDIASGEGYGSTLLAEAAESVIGVDIALEAVQYATSKYQRHNLEFRHGDCSTIPLPDASVDVVVSFETIEHHDRHDEMMREVKRVLRPGGLLIISSPDKREYSDVPGYANPYHVRELYRDQFDALLAAHFERHSLVGQRVIYGSAMFSGSVQGVTIYSSDDSQGQEVVPRPMYFVALASDAELPAIGNSFFQHDVERSDAVRDRETIIHARDLELDERGMDIAEKKARLNEQEIELERLTAELEEQRTEFEKQSTELEEQRAELEEQGAKLEEQRTELEDNKRELFHWLQRQAILQSQAHNLIWLAKRFVKRLLQWPKEARQARHHSYQIAASGLFDPAWYLSQNSDVQVLGLDPLKHYLRFGGYEGRSASPHFNTLEHLRQHPELLHLHIHPLLHYLQQQAQQAREQPAQQNASDESQPASGDVLHSQLVAGARGHGPEYVELSDKALDEPSRIRAIAFYLPQFHPIDENDRWWGKGFTEWTNVSKAVPEFAGHYQPRLPGELGFYDLRLPEVQERQAELARQHGLTAFCFHHYWFSGRRRLLERPLEQYVANPNIDFPFCVCWANENWTRRWDGKEDDVLMAQAHDPADNREFIEDLAPLLEDSRYLRVDGKPVIIVYRVDILPDARLTADTWRDYCRERGIGELHLVAAQSFGIGDPRDYGFDAAVEFPPHDTHARRIEHELQFINPEFTGQVYDYPDLVGKQLAKPRVDYRRYRTVFPGWDNDARKPGRGHIFTHASPARYQQWLAGVSREADLNPGDEKLVFINAWNEWAEGAYLEPDRRYGYAYLEATKQVLAQFPSVRQHGSQDVPEALLQAQAKHDTAVILHLYHTELWPEIADHLDTLEDEYDLYVSLPEHARPEVETEIRERKPDATLVMLPNRGRDVAPFLTVLRAIRPLGYAQVCKIHAKRSLHRQDGDLWRREFLGRLLGSRKQVTRILDAFREKPEIGMIGPAGHWLAYSRYWGHPDSPARTRTLLESVGISMSLDELHFFAGSMFWCRPAAMDRLLDNITLDDFEVELGQTDGTLAHALERVFAAACQAAGLRVTDTAEPAAADEPNPEQQYPFALASPPLNNGVAPEQPHAPPPLDVRAKRFVRRVGGALKRRLG